MTTGARDLRLLAGAVLLSAAGDLIAMIALALQVHEVSGSGLAVSAFFATLMLPSVLLAPVAGDRKSTRLNSSHANISYAVFCLKKNNHYTLTLCALDTF